MIATGGLLRISARRQDSLRSKNRAENKRKRKARKRRKNEVVVVKGKLKLCSVPGLVAAVGILILMVGIALAILGYWPRQRPSYQGSLPPLGRLAPERVHDKRLTVAANWSASGRHVHHLDRDISAENASNVTAGESPKLGFFAAFLKRHLYSDKLKVFGPLIMGIGIFLFICANAVLHENRDKKTKIINLRDIYSTVIDIHSLRSKENVPLNGFVNYVQSKGMESKPSAMYTAALLAKSSWPSGAEHSDCEDLDLSRRHSFGKFESSSLPRQSFTDTVYSIYREQNCREEQALSPRHWETRTIVPSSVNAFTLPMVKLNSLMRDNRRASVRADFGRGERKRVDAFHGSADSLDRPSVRHVGCSTTQAKVETGHTHRHAHAYTRTVLPQDSIEVYKSSGSLAGAASASPSRVSPLGSQAQLLPHSPSHKVITVSSATSAIATTGSHLSLSALSDYSRSAELGANGPGTPGGEWRRGERPRRLSCPRLEGYGYSGVGYSYGKLGDLGGESFESSEAVLLSQVTSVEVLDREPTEQPSDEPDSDSDSDGEGRRQKAHASGRRYSNREKLIMISQSDTTLEDDEIESLD